MMIYPNRTHGINEGRFATQHMRNTFIKFIEGIVLPAQERLKSPDLKTV